VVDVANVMGARADGWWKDRAAAAARLCREVAALASRGLAPGELPDGALPDAPGGRCFPGWVLVLEGSARDAAAVLLPGAPTGAGGTGPDLVLPGSGGLARLVLASGVGDDAIAAQAASLRGGGVVTTADRELRRRCEQAGATAAGPGWLLRLL
jgi:8-oxo-dGTP diphosphatase